MKDQDTVQQFIELRSRGISLARIAQQLGVSPNTLVKWSREHQHLIQNLRAIEWEAFVDQTIASKQDRLKTVSDQLRRIEAELAQRQLADIPTPRLQTMAEQLRRRIDLECGVPLFSAGVELSRDDDTRPAVQDWRA
jgi:transposase-like protein